MTKCVIVVLSKKRTITEHDRLSRAVELKTGVFLSLLSCSRAISIIMGSCI